MSKNATTNDLEQERIRAALSAIVERNHGVLNPHHVIDVASDPAHVLHGYFEWDNDVCGDAYRLLQVGALVRRVKLTVVRPDPVTREIQISTTRGYQSRPSMRSRDGGYEPIQSILSDADKRMELIGQVMRELASYRRRYAELEELQPVWLAVDEAATDWLPQDSPSTPDGEHRPGAAG